MKLALNPLLTAVATPPIPEVHGWIVGRHFPAEKPLIDVAQAIPGYPPPKPLTDHLAAIIGDPTSAPYTDVPGLPGLRAALARDVGQFYDADIASADVTITAGCNQAFCLTLLALARACDEIILPVPYYFNHQMWLDMQGIGARHLPFRPERGGVPDPAEAAAMIGPRTRAIVLVSPNNPTGAVFPAEVIAEFYNLARRHDIALILDETYRDFMPTDDAPHGLFSEPDWRETLVQLYSFSKAYCKRLSRRLDHHRFHAQRRDRQGHGYRADLRAAHRPARRPLRHRSAERMAPDQPGADARAAGGPAQGHGAQRPALPPGQRRCLFRLYRPPLRRPERDPGCAPAGG
jgi:hypothetical protein